GGPQTPWRRPPPGPTGAFPSLRTRPIQEPPMRALPANNNPPVADQAGQTPPRSAVGAALTPGGALAPFIAVRCPNPACGTPDRAKTSLAGKQGKCPDCGAVIPIPNVTASALDRPAEKSPGRAAAVHAEVETREELTRRDGPELKEVRAACIGRENAG